MSKAIKELGWVQFTLNSLKGGLSLAMLVCLCWCVTLVVTAKMAIVSAQGVNLAARIDALKQSSVRWIVVDLSEQRLNAWEGNTLVFSAAVSTGRSDEPTPTGVFEVQTKLEKAWMQGENYDVPNVPYAMFYSGNYAIHGAYWHEQFGSPVSSGCINLPIDQAAWLYNWAEVGTPVVVAP
jgi:lipoprotein-anchoring transpeptidase ErfK/SrfK